MLSAYASASGSVYFGFFGGKFKADIQAKALPALGGSVQLAKVYMESKIRFFIIRVDKKVFDFTHNISSSTLLPIDGASGGMSPVDATSINDRTSGNEFLGLLYSFKASGSATLNSFTFVPTPSALDIQTYDTPSLSSTYVSGWSPKNPSRAATFIAQEGSGSTFNESHTRFTARNAEWLFSEMEGISNTLNCSASCSPNVSNVISGASQICATETYSIPNLPAGATVSWSANPYGKVSITTSNNVATVTKIINGVVDLTATINTSCGNVVTTPKSLQVGPENIPIGGMIQNAQYGGGQYITLSAGGNYVSSSNYTWTVYGASIVSGQGTNTITILTNQNNSETDLYLDVLLSISVENCGVAYGESHALVSKSGLPTYNRIAIYPNPANTEIKIVRKSTEHAGIEAKTKTTVDDIRVKLLNGKGKVLKDSGKSSISKDIVLQVADIPDGIYYLHIYEGKNVSKQQVVIAH